VTGAYGESKDKNLAATAAANTNAGNLVAVPFLGPIQDKNKMLSIQAGIEQKWFGLGKTTVWGEYIKSNSGNGLNGGQLRTVGGTDAATVGTALAGVTSFITSSSVTTYGIGFNQSIEAAAADFYIHARNFSANVDLSNAAGTIRASGSPKDFQAIMTGMVIRF
jgi:hypothetical protein